jgi:hypothetical protein
MSRSAANSSPGSALATPATRRRIFIPAALLATALAVVGFWRTYFSQLIVGQIDEPAIVHIHTAVMVTWLALFIGQVWLAASGRVRLHVRLGPWLMTFGIVVVVAGLLVTSEGFASRLARGDVARAQRWLFGPLRDVVFFVPFLIAGWLYRRRPDVHKRVMLVATTILVLPAISRMTFLGFPVPLWKFMLIWPLPVYLAMAHDFLTRRIVHPAYVIGILAMLAMRLVLPLNQSAVWHAMAAHITAYYEAPGP